MSAPKRLEAGQRAALEHLDPNDYWDLNAKWKVESGFIAKRLVPQRAADAAKDASRSWNDKELTAYASERWTAVDTELRSSYCGGDVKEDSTIVDMAKHDAFRVESPTSGSVTRMFILFWIAACCEVTIFVVQGVFSGGFNPIIILLAVLLAFGGFLTGAGIGRMLHTGWYNDFLNEPKEVTGVMWAQVVIGLVLIISVAAFRAYGAGELAPGVLAFLITILLGALCALFETLHQQVKLKREDCLQRQGQAQTWTAYETHKHNLPRYKELFLNELAQRTRAGGNITAPPPTEDGLVTLVGAVAVIFMLALAIPSGGRAACTRRVATGGPSARVIVLAGGDAWMLFQQYLFDVRQKNLDVSLWQSTVMVSSGGKSEAIKLGWAKMLTGESSERLWERALSGRKAEVNAELLTQADSGGWDVVCMGGPVKAQPQKPGGGAAPRSSEALTYFKSGLQYAARADYENAIKEFKVVERIDSHFPDLQMNLGVAHMQRKDYVHASEYMTRAIEWDGGNPNVHYNMACLQARLGQADDAIASLTTAKARGFVMTARVRNDSDFTSLRGRKDFEALFANK